MFFLAEENLFLAVGAGRQNIKDTYTRAKGGTMRKEKRPLFHNRNKNKGKEDQAQKYANFLTYKA